MKERSLMLERGGGGKTLFAEREINVTGGEDRKRQIGRTINGIQICSSRTTLWC